MEIKEPEYPHYSIDKKTTLFYRQIVNSTLKSWNMVIGESDINVYSERVLKQGTWDILSRLRDEIKSFSECCPQFLVSLKPVEKPDGLEIPSAVGQMLSAGKLAGVGPMAAVAGTIAEKVCRYLGTYQREVIVENGGDIFICSEKPRICAIFAGDSPFSLQIGVSLEPEQFPCALCTSSGTVGPSLSFGKADVAVVAATSGAVADALATSLANKIQQTGDLKPSVEETVNVPNVIGALAILNDKLAVKGDLKLVQLD